MPALRSPVVDMIDVSDSTRSGRVTAIVWPIMPPIDTPITCARSMPSPSSRPKLSFAMSVSRYGASMWKPAIARTIGGTGASM